MKIRRFWKKINESEYIGDIYCGIDPGSEGSFSALDCKGNLIETFGFKSHTERDLVEKLAFWMTGASGYRPVFCMIEKVHAVPGWGVASSFNFGVNFGTVKTCVVMCEIPFDLVIPKKWQTKMKCLSGGDKTVTLQKAQQLFPSVKMTKTGAKAVYDSLLIAEYGRRVSLGIDFG